MKSHGIDHTILRLQIINECLRAQLKMRRAHRTAHSIGRPGVFPTTLNTNAWSAAIFQSNIFK